MPLTRSSHREFVPLSDEERARLEAAIAMVERVFVHAPAAPTPKVEE